MKSRIFAAALLAATLLVSCSDKKVYLFNGKNMDGWKVVLKEEADAFSGASTFSVENEMIHITGQPFGYARTEKKYSNYSLHLEWRWAGPKGVDGGVFNYLQDGDKVWPQGVQLQMTPKDMGMLMGGIPIEGVEGPFYRKERIVAESPENGTKWSSSARTDRSNAGSTGSWSMKLSATSPMVTSPYSQRVDRWTSGISIFLSRNEPCRLTGSTCRSERPCPGRTDKPVRHHPGRLRDDRFRLHSMFLPHHG